MTMIGEFFLFIVEMYFAVGVFVLDFYARNSRIILDAMHLFFKNGFNVLILITMLLAFSYFVMSLFGFTKQKNADYTLEKEKEPFVTIQIPTYNELAAINCAKRCIEFDYPKDKMQIIIGDDSNKPEVSKAIDDFAREHKGLVLVTRRGKNIGYKPGNLNHMLKYTKGEFIIIFDSDFLPESDFLRKMVAPFLHDDNLSVVQARWRIDNFNQNLKSMLGGSVSLLSHHVVMVFMNRLGLSSFLCGSAEVIRKSHLEEVGGWTSGSLTEDIECSLRLKKNNRNLIYLEDVECDCEAPYTLPDLSKQQMRWAYGVISSVKMHFFGILFSKKTKLKDKLGVFIFASGYFFSMLLLLITIFGFFSVITNAPAPIDIPRFLSETGMNILLTSGLLLSVLLSLGFSRRIKYAHKILISSLSLGLLVTFYVNLGILKSLFGREMKWFMLKKNGNKVN